MSGGDAQDIGNLTIATANDEEYMFRQDNIFVLESILENDRTQWWTWNVLVVGRADDPPEAFGLTERPVREGYLYRYGSIFQPMGSAAQLFERMAKAGVFPSAEGEELHQQLTEIVERVKSEGTELPDSFRVILAKLGLFDKTEIPEPRKPNRKVILPYSTGELLLMPNIQLHGTRNLGHVLAGDPEWVYDPNQGAMVARTTTGTVGMIDLSNGMDEEGARRIINALAPRALQTIVAVSKLVYEKTAGMPINQVATLNVREIAIACGKKPDSSRKIDPDTLRRIGMDLRAASSILTWGADGPRDPKQRSRQSGWVSPILHITAVHVEQIGLDGDPIPYEFDVLLGRNWAAAIKEHYDVVQIAPGFMQLNPAREDQAIRLAWYYLTDFRYRMRRGPRRNPPSIKDMVAEARLQWDSQNLRRSLGRLHKAHERLAELEIIGTFERTPSIEVDNDNRSEWNASRVYEQGSYRVEAPAAILKAYQDHQKPNGSKARARVRNPV
jgi:hypothetical protein